MIWSYPAELLRVIDGDTVELRLDVGFGFDRRKASYRLLRINAPEMNTAQGKTSKRLLDEFLQGKTLVAQSQKSDNFGRWLVELWADNINVSDWLVENQLAEYHTYK